MTKTIFPSDYDDLSLDDRTRVQCCVQHEDSIANLDPEEMYGLVILHARFARWQATIDSDFTLQDYLDEVE